MLDVQLAEFYGKHYRNGDFEVLFVSSDKSPEDMKKYWATAGIPGIAVQQECKQAHANTMVTRRSALRKE